MTRLWGRLSRVLAVLATLSLLLGIGPALKADANPVLPDPPATLSASQRSTVAILSWPAVDGARGYAVEYDTDAAFVASTRLTTADTVIVVSGLTAETTYFARVASWDPQTDAVGEWSLAISYTTGPQEFAVAPPVVTLSATTSTSITAEWSTVDKNARYQAKIGKQPDALGDEVSVKDPTTTFDGLDRTTTYYVSVRAVDSAADPVTAWSAPARLETPEALPLRVGSFNIKCYSCREKGEKGWAQRKSAVVSTILSQTPDVLGVQEASQGRMRGRKVSQFIDLVNGLGAPYAVTNRARVGRGAGLDSRIIYNTETMTLIKQGSVLLPTGKGANIRRYLVWATFRQNSTGKVFLFGNTHLDNGSQVKALRLRQVKLIIKTLKRISGGKLPTIMVGDFNTHKWISGGNKPYNAMVSAGYLDPLGNTYKSRHTAPGAFVETRINTNYSSTNGYERKARKLPYINGTYLDYIFVTKMRVAEWETVVKVDRNGRYIGTIPSDHNMVRATVYLP